MVLLSKTFKVLWVKSDICIISTRMGEQVRATTMFTYTLLFPSQTNPAQSSSVTLFLFLACGRFAMYDMHYLCRARYDSGYSCLHQVSSLLSDCVKLSDVLTMSLSFRSNVNYIPPPQEVS